MSENLKQTSLTPTFHGSFLFSCFIFNRQLRVSEKHQLSSFHWFCLFQLHPQLPADVRAHAAVWLQGDWTAQERGWLLPDRAPYTVPGRPQTPAALPDRHLRGGGGAFQHQKAVQVLQPCRSHHHSAHHHHQGQWEQVWFHLFMAEYSVTLKKTW